MNCEWRAICATERINVTLLWAENQKKTELKCERAFVKKTLQKIPQDTTSMFYKHTTKRSRIKLLLRILNCINVCKYFFYYNETKVLIFSFNKERIFRYIWKSMLHFLVMSFLYIFFFPKNVVPILSHDHKSNIVTLKDLWIW